MVEAAGESGEDKILLEGMVFYGYHGVRQAEKELGQRFVVDLTVWRDLAAAGWSDDLTQTTSYSALYRLVESIVTGPACNLIETVAERIATAVLAQFPLDAVRVRVRKPEAPLPGVFASAAVEITRRRVAQSHSQLR
jgi:dihydroneopterin aldolase